MDTHPKHPDVAEMFDKILTELGLSGNQLAAALGTSQQVISNYATGRNKPSVEILANLAQKFTRLNPEWLLTGRGEMLRTKEPMLPGAEINHLGVAQRVPGTRPPISLKDSEPDSQLKNELAEQPVTDAKSFIEKLVREADALRAENGALREQLNRKDEDTGKVYRALEKCQEQNRVSQEQISILLGKSNGNQSAPTNYYEEQIPLRAIVAGLVRYDNRTTTARIIPMYSSMPQLARA
jgi:transcriptional regulator with XRE-family HTH domain